MAAAGTPPPTTRSPASACKGVGHGRVHQHRPVEGRVKTISVQRGGGQWYVILAGDEVPAESLPGTGAVTGIDMGMAHFLTTAKGRAQGRTPGPASGTADALADAQRALTAFPPVHAGQPNRPASPCGGEGRHAASPGCAASGRITRTRPPGR